MIDHLRKLLVWLVFLALPLQGHAADLMASCGGSDATVARAASTSDAPVGLEQAVDGIAAGGTPCGGAEPGAMHCDPAKAAVAQCGMAAGCAATLGLPLVAVFALFAPAGSAAPQSGPGLADVGFFTDALDRPPRLLIV